MLFVTDVSGWREDLFRDTQRPLMCPLGIIVNRPPCCQVLTSIHGHIRQKPPAIFEAFTATYQKICCCMIFQSPKTMKKTTKKHSVWEGILSFFYSVLHFWIKQYTNFLDLNKFVSYHHIATQATFTGTNLSPHSIFWYGLFWVIWRWPRSPGNTDRPIKSAVARPRQGFTCKSGKNKKSYKEKKHCYHYQFSTNCPLYSEKSLGQSKSFIEFSPPREDLAEVDEIYCIVAWLERLTANAEVATVLDSIPASSDTVKSEGRQLKKC